LAARFCCAAFSGEENKMKKLVLAVAAMGLMTTCANAQSTVTTTTGIARESVQIEA